MISIVCELCKEQLPNVSLKLWNRVINFFIFSDLLLVIVKIVFLCIWIVFTQRILRFFALKVVHRPLKLLQNVFDLFLDSVVLLVYNLGKILIDSEF